MNNTTRRLLLEQAYQYEHGELVREKILNDKILEILYQVTSKGSCDTADDCSCSKVHEQPSVRDPVDTVEADLGIRHYQ